MRFLTHNTLNLWLLFCALLPAVLGGVVAVLYVSGHTLLSYDWVPSLGIRFGLNTDGLSVLFAGLICGIGFLIQIYAISYMRGKSGRFSFHLYLTLFMLAMLGLVLSDDIILLFIFWELTTITSYLLIGFNHETGTSRKNALQALLVTGIGGLALLAGLILLGEAGDTYSMAEIAERAGTVKNHALFTPSLILILLGAFTKSAQFPFHFWLPNAMAAPTPVSAYLHSATMVKAGIYLLARVAPIYGDSDLWFYALGAAGGITAIWAGLLAFRQTDLKLILAYTTVAVLGKITFLLAFNTAYAITAALLLIIAHAFYKAALFMIIGIIDKSTGTRELSDLSGLKSVLIFTFVGVMIAVLSAIGIPPLLGFISKEYMYKAGLGINWPMTALLVTANAIVAGVTLNVALKPFLNGKNKKQTKAKSVEKDIGLWLPSVLLGAMSLVLPLFALGMPEEVIIAPASQVIHTAGKTVPVVLWQGVNLPLILSVITVILAGLLYKMTPQIKKALDSATGFLPSGSDIYQKCVDGILYIAKRQTDILQSKQLSRYALISFIALACLLFAGMPSSLAVGTVGTITFYEILLAVLLLSAVLTCVFSSSRLTAIASLGMVGFLTTLVFMIYSAPDVAKTQLLVETLVVVFLTLIIRHLPPLHTVAPHSIPRRVLHFGVAGIIGLSVALLLMNITAYPIDNSLHMFFAENSVPGGHGRNIVNVILVDFRAFDTFGEIIVVVIAAIAASGLLKKGKGAKQS